MDQIKLQTDQGTCTTHCALHLERMAAYVNGSPFLEVVSTSLFKLIASNLNFQSVKICEEAHNLIDSYNSLVTGQNLTYRDSLFTSQSMQLVKSNLTFTASNFQNLTSSSVSVSQSTFPMLIFANLETQLTLTSSTFTQVKVTFLGSTDSKTSITGSTLQNCLAGAFSNFVLFTDSEITMTDSTLNNLESDKSIFTISDSKVLFQSTQSSGQQKRLFKASDSEVTLQNTTVSSSVTGIEVDDSTLVVRDSTF